MKCEWKSCFTNGDNCSLKRLVKWNQFKNLGVNWVHNQSLMSIQFWKHHSVLSGLGRKLFPEMNFKFLLEIKDLKLDEEWRGTETMLLEAQGEVFTVSGGLGFYVICGCWSTVFSEVCIQCATATAAAFRSLSCLWHVSGFFFPIYCINPNSEKIQQHDINPV